MKKFILPLLLILFVSTLVAAQSEASDVVGYFKVNAPADAWSQVSIPFHIETGMPSEIFGNQFNAGDYVYDPYANTSSDYYGPGLDEGWYPDDAGFVAPGHFYYVKIDAANPGVDYYVLGTVNPSGFTLDMLGQDIGGWTPFALNEAVPVFVGDLGIQTLIADDVLGLYDQIYDINTNISAQYYGPVDGWYASNDEPFYIQPTHCYYFQSWTDSGFSWTYVPVTSRQASNQLNINPTRRTK